MNYQEILASTAIQAILLAALAFLTRSIILHWLGKDIEGFKTMVNTHAQRMIEEFKAQLAREAREHRVRFESLHHKRAEAIEALYEKPIRARDTMERLVTSWEAKNANEFQDAREEFWRLRLELALKRIYLPETLREDLSHCTDLMWKPAVAAGVWANIENEANRQKADAAFEEAQAAIRGGGSIPTEFEILKVSSERRWGMLDNQE
jgi:hypothetical protein